MPIVNCITQHVYVSAGCYDGESNKIIHVLFVQKGEVVDFTSPSTLLSSITALIGAEKALFIPNVSGSKGAASTKEGKGAGRAVKRILNKEHSMNYVDFQYIDNVPTYNALEVNANNYYLLYWTTNYIWKTNINSPVSVKADDVITDDNGTTIEATINVSWNQKGNPLPYESNSADFDLLASA